MMSMDRGGKPRAVCVTSVVLALMFASLSMLAGCQTVISEPVFRILGLVFAGIVAAIVCGVALLRWVARMPKRG
jgi:hypothetical protein